MCLSVNYYITVHSGQLWERVLLEVFSCTLLPTTPTQLFYNFISVITVFGRFSGSQMDPVLVFSRQGFIQVTVEKIHNPSWVIVCRTVYLIRANRGSAARLILACNFFLWLMAAYIVHSSVGFYSGHSSISWM